MKIILTTLCSIIFLVGFFPFFADASWYKHSTLDSLEPWDTETDWRALDFSGDFGTVAHAFDRHKKEGGFYDDRHLHRFHGKEIAERYYDASGLNGNTPTHAPIPASLQLLGSGVFAIAAWKKWR